MCSSRRVNGATPLWSRPNTPSQKAALSATPLRARHCEDRVLYLDIERASQLIADGSLDRAVGSLQLG